MWRPTARALRRAYPAGARRVVVCRKAVEPLPLENRPAGAISSAFVSARSGSWESGAWEERRAGWHLAAFALGSALAWNTLSREERGCSCIVSCSGVSPGGYRSPDESILKSAVSTAASARSSSKEMVDVEPTQSSTNSGIDAGAPSSPCEAPGRAVALSLASEYNANGPIEDRHEVHESPRGDFFASVYDGHGGWQAAEFARRRLSIAAQTELNNSLAKSTDQIKGALTHAFLRVEREYLYRVKTAFELGFGSVAKTGSCVIMALVRDDRLFVANAGDCRAVLGRRRRHSALGWGSAAGEGTVEAVALSNDHNAREKAEQEKLRRLHPSEEDIVKCKRSNACYVKGRLQPTRSLGDAYLKYSEFNGQAGMHSSAGRFLPPPYTPPYITAEPEIHVHKIDPTQDEFVVLASDGLWDYVTSTEAVEIVQKAAYTDGDPTSAADRLVDCVLERTAERYDMTVEGLKDVQEGPSRRSKHDDVTCVVFYFQGSERNREFASLDASLGAPAQGNAERYEQSTGESSRSGDVAAARASPSQ